jgi:uncharacterized LabA/DUF88 family protein
MNAHPIITPTTYLFIDGGYLRRYYTKAALQWFDSEGEINIGALKQSFKAQKSFYYDCLDDLLRPGEAQAEFETRLAQQEEFFNKIREAVGSHVKLGSLTGAVKNRRQKKVDILLAVDMLNHAVRRNMERAVLLSGDRDFEPVVESLVQMGLFVEVAAVPGHFAKDLALAADSFREIRFNDFHFWTAMELRKKYPINFPTLNSPSDRAVLVKRGKMNGKAVSAYGFPNDNIFYIDLGPDKNKNKTVFQATDLQRLETYIALQYSPIVWE